MSAYDIYQRELQKIQKAQTKKKKKNTGLDNAMSEYESIRNEISTKGKQSFIDVLGDNKKTGSTGLSKWSKINNSTPSPVKLSDEEYKNKLANSQEKPWYQRIFTTGEFKDGYQFGDISKTILGTATDISEELGKGVLSPVESVVDIGANLVASGANALGYKDAEKSIRDFANADLAGNIAKNVGQPTGLLYNIVNGTPEKIFNPTGYEWNSDKNLLENGLDLAKRSYLGLDADGKPITEEKDYEKSSVFGEYAEKTTELVGYGLSLAIGGGALSGATKTASVGSSTLGATANAGNIGINIAGKTLNIPTLALAGGMAGGLEEANQKEDVTELQRWTKALSSGAIEGITEGLFGMLKVGGVTNEAGEEVFDVLASKLSSNFKSQLAKTLTSVGIKASGESVEEFLSYGANYLVDNGIIDKLGQADFSKEWDWGEVAEQMALAFVSAGISQGGSTVIQTNEAIKSAEDQLGRKLTKEEKELVTQASIEGAVEQKVAELENRLNTQNETQVQPQTNLTLEEIDNQIATLESQLNENLSDKQYSKIENQIKELENQAELIERNGQISPTTTQQTETNSLVDAPSNTLKNVNTQENINPVVNEQQETDNHIKDVSTGYSSDEYFMEMQYTQDGKIVGTLKYGEYQGEPNIKMIEVDPEYRRKGIGTKLLQELQNKYPDVEIDFGMSTPDGTALLEKATYQVENKDVIEKQKRIDEIKEKIEEYDKGYENFFENDIPVPKNYAEDYNELYDEQRRLEEEIRGKSAYKTFVKTKEQKTTTEKRESISPVKETNSKVEQIKAEYARARENAKIIYAGDNETLSRKSKMYGMQEAAEKREAIQGDLLIPVEGGLTAKELNNKIEKLKSNYRGKQVIVDGKQGKVIGTSFGKIGIEFEDGTQKYVDGKEIKPVEDIDEIIKKQTDERYKKMFSSKKSESISPTKSETTPKVQEELAPLKQATKELKQVQKEVKAQVKELKQTMKEVKALAEAQVDANLQSLTDNDLAPIKENTTPEYQYENDNEGSQSKVESPIQNRDMKEVGKRNVNAYQYENPEFKPYFQTEARIMLNELQNSVKGEKVWTQEFNPETGLLENAMVTGTTRQTTNDIAYLLDNYNYTYADIQKGLNAIIEDKGKENIAVAKRVEIMLDERLRNGYTSVDGTQIPANQEYINFLNQNNLTDYYQSVSQGIENTEPPVETISPVGKNELGYTPVDPRKAEAYENKPTADEVLNRFVDNAVQRQANKDVASYERGMASPINTQEKTFKEKASGAWDTLQSHFVNRNRQIDKLAKAKNNPEIKFKGDRLNNISAEVGGDIFTAQTNNYGQAIGKSLDSPFEKARTLGISQELDNYLKHQSNIERHARGKGSATVSAETSRKYVEAYETKYPIVKPLARDVYTYNQNLLNNAVQNGLISKEFRNSLIQMYGHYVPFVETDVEATPSVDISPEEIKSSQVIKRATGGSNENLLSIEQAMIKQTYAYKNAIAKNDLYREIVNSIDEKVDIGADIRVSPTQLDDSLYADENGKYLTAYIKGEQKTVKISDELFNELNRDLEKQIKEIEDRYSIITKPLQKISQIRGQILTTYNPSFIVQNPLKDIQDALLNTKDIKGYMSHIASAMTDSTNADPKNMKEYARKFKEITGLDINSVADTTNLSKEAQKLYEFYDNGLTWNQFMTLYGNNATQLEYQDSTVDTIKGSKKAKNKGFLNKLGNANNFMEVMFRYPEFKASVRNGKSATEALYNAREVTTNFGRGGTIAKAINRNGATFYNTSIQGLDKFIRNFSGENGARGFVGAVGKAFALGIIPAILNHMFFGDDEEYEALPDYVKDNYYIFKTGEGEFIRIPKGRMISVLGSAGRRSIELLSGEKNAFDGYLKNASSQVGSTNPLKENILSPIIQAVTNEAWYGGDLVPKRLQDKPAGEQYDETTDELSKWIGGKLNISPYKINYVIDQYSGGFGDIALPLMTKEATNSEKGLGNLLAPVKDKFVVNSTSDNKYVGDLYDTSEKLTKKANSSNASNEDILMNKYMNSVKADMNKLYKERREVQNDTTLTKEEKYAKVQEIQKEINKLAKEGLDSYENISTYSNYAKVGDREYYLNTKNEWQKVDDDELDDLNSMGMTSLEKDIYFNTKNEISRIANDYKDDKKDLNDLYGSDEDSLKREIDSLSEDKQKNIINQVLRANLTDEEKTYLYSKYYSSEKSLEKITSQGVSMDSYLEYKYNTIEYDSDVNKDGDTVSGSLAKKKINYLLNSGLSSQEIQTFYEYDILGDFDNAKKHTGYKAVKAMGVDINSWLTFSTQEFEADYNYKGNAIPNSKRNKVISYVNTLPLDIPQKASIIRTQYSSFDDYNNDIVSYVNGLSISYEEKIEIIESLDMRVLDDGTVRWD